MTNNLHSNSPFNNHFKKNFIVKHNTYFIEELLKCKDLGSIFSKDPGLFVNVCCVFTTKKVQIPGASYLSKTQDLVFKQGFVKKMVK
jgi:hypothetical protein